jgi:hypothetical protein
MPRGYTTRKLESFSINAHVAKNGTPPQRVAADYAEVFRRISTLPKEFRIAAIGNKNIAIPRCSMNGNVVKLTAYEGEDGNPIVFNFEDATERMETLARGEQIATKTHGIIDVASRLAIIEFNQRGAKAPYIAAALEHFGRTLGEMPTLQIQFAQKIDERFVQAIDRFTRIRTATVKIARPNPGWTDHTNHFAAMADDSDADNLELTASAKRMGSLDRGKGIIAFIRDVASVAFPSLKAAKIVGIREGESAETSVSMAHHIEHQRVQVRTTDEGHVSDEDIDRRLENFRRSTTDRKQN